jgi:hypothetical protein
MRNDLFDTTESMLTRYGIDIGLLLSGFFGALLLVSRKSGQKLGTSLAALMAGTACANYLTPIVLNYMPETVRLNGKYAIAFAMGFLGLKGLEFIIDTYIISKKQETHKKTRKKRKH